MLKTQDYSKTGIAGTYISFKQDVKPKAKQLTQAGVPVYVMDTETTTSKGNTVKEYHVYRGLECNEDSFVFYTSNIAAVWTYLLGLDDACVRKLEDEVLGEKLPDLDNIKIPSKKFLLEVFCNRAWGGDVKRCRDAWNDFIEQVHLFQKAGAIPTKPYNSVEQVITDIQSACYLNAENEIGIFLTVMDHQKSA